MSFTDPPCLTCGSVHVSWIGQGAQRGGTFSDWLCRNCGVEFRVEHPK